MGYFAERTNWNSAPNDVTAILNDLKQSNKIIYDLTVSNPTQCGFHYPIDDLLKELYRESNIIYEADPRGLLCAREAVVRYYQTRGVKVDPVQIFLTASTSEAYGFLFRLLADVGDQVVFPRPSYPLFEFLAGINDLQWKTYDLKYDERWVLSREVFKNVFKDSVRAAVLVNPNNPTGSCFRQNDMDFILKECSRKEVPIICDEVFLDYIFGGINDAKTLAGNVENLTFVLGGLSKSLALPQMKLSWIIVSGPERQAVEAMKRLEIIADTYLSVNTPVQNALPGWLELADSVRQQVLGRIRENREFLKREALNFGGKVKILNADGGWSAVVKADHVGDDEAFVMELLKEEHTFVHPGYFFDFDEEGFFVISLLPDEKVFQEGVRRFLYRTENQRI